MLLFQVETLGTEELLRSFAVHHQDFVMLEADDRFRVWFGEFYRNIGFDIRIRWSSLWGGLRKLQNRRRGFVLLLVLLPHCTVGDLVGAGRCSVAVIVLADNTTAG